MEYTFLTKNKEIIKIDLIDVNDELIVNQPSNIIAFKASSHGNRKDFIFDEIKIKKYQLKSKINGESSIYIKSSNNSEIKILELNDKKYVFNFNILFYTKDVKVNLYLDEFAKFIYTNDAFQYKCSGSGIIGYYAEGTAIDVLLSIGETIFINPYYVLGYEDTIKYEFKTYGNTKAALNMDYHYKFTGPGNIIVQTQALIDDILKVNKTTGDNVFKRALKEWIPGGSVILK